MKRMLPYLTGIWYSLPVQLLLLHFKRYQVLLLFWLILFATINGSFMPRFGANILYLYPEYLGQVNALSLALVGAAVAIFMMSWNITTFILHANQIRFLATTTQPFLKYCINNGILPLAFLLFYCGKAFTYLKYQELLSTGNILVLAGGFLLGFVLATAFGFTYFFGADRTLYRFMSPTTREALLRHKHRYEKGRAKRIRGIIRVDWYLSATLKLRRPRSVRHYTMEFIDRMFKQHHLVALFSVLVAFISLILIGFALDNVYFQIPAAASITVFFAVLIAVAGAFAYFLQSWSLLFLLVLSVAINFLYQKNILDIRNRAYGVDYSRSEPLPEYSNNSLRAIANADAVRADSLAFINILENWKRRQKAERPVFIAVAASGGGTRASAFTLNVLQSLDSVTNNASTSSMFMITGASGGMMGAAWYRELYLRKSLGSITVDQMKQYTDDVNSDLLNPIFTSFVARDLLSPPQWFNYKGIKYRKDRGFAFEEKLNTNTHGWMNKSITDYQAVEDTGLCPRLFINAVITRDGRKLVMSSRPARFLMEPLVDTSKDYSPDPDAIDFLSMFKDRQAGQLRILTALRMNATFPYVLPNVWLPSSPVIDVMDAGFRDNTGVESALKFMYFFREWLGKNCSKVLLVQISDKLLGGWQAPDESDDIIDLFFKPALLTQTTLFRFQEYAQLRQLEWFHAMYGPSFNRILFTYSPLNKEAAATLSFHLTQREKQDLKLSLNNYQNRNAMIRAQKVMTDTTSLRMK